MKVTLKRINMSSKHTFGVFSIDDNPICFTLERPWIGNKRNISCIPEGKYECVLHTSYSKNKILDNKVFKLVNVPNRDNILIHIGNWVTDSQGCILVGIYVSDNMVCNSTAAMKKLLQRLPEKFIIEICNC